MPALKSIRADKSFFDVLGEMERMELVQSQLSDGKRLKQTTGIWLCKRPYGSLKDHTAVFKDQMTLDNATWLF